MIILNISLKIDINIGSLNYLIVIYTKYNLFLDRLYSKFIL